MIGSCDSPFFVENPRPWDGNGKEIPVPCGKCPKCINRRVNGWVFRCMQEEKRSTGAHFVTLTYNTENVPITKNGFMTLNKKDLQNFWKRLRKDEKNKIKYYAVGEYGSKKERPHYHAIVYNVSDADAYHRNWQLGDVYLGTVTGDSVGYTAGYINKGKIVPKHSRDDRVQEFSVMSKGLGSNYLTDEKIKYHKNDVSRNYVMLEGGVKVALPRYYREKIYNDDEKAEQRKMIEKEFIEQEKKEKLIFEKKYPNIGTGFEVYQDQKKIARRKHLDSRNRNSRNKF